MLKVVGMPNLEAIIIGSGGHAVSIAETVQASGVRIIGFIGEVRNQTTLFGLPIMTEEQALQAPLEASLVLAIGDNFKRERVWQRWTELVGPQRFPPFVHPSASVASSAQIHPGTLVMQGAIVGSKAQIGIGCLINSGAIAEHEVDLQDFSSLAPGATTGGRVRVGRRTAISIGATVLQGIDIGDDAVIGASSLVNSDIPAKVVAYGSPARVVRSRNLGDQYLGPADNPGIAPQRDDKAPHA